MNSLTKDSNYVLNTYKRLPIVVKKAKGSYIYDQQGRKYLDMYAGIAVNSVGHSNIRVRRAIETQLKKHMHLSNYFVSETQNELAKKLVEYSFASKVFFTNSGTEAIEASFKLARKYGKSISSDKFEVIALHESFHGRTMGGLSLTGQPKYQEAFAPLVPGVVHIEKNNIEALKKAVSSKTCAIFIEMVQGESGIHVLTDAFLNEIIQLKEAHQFLIIADEVQTGLMRTGKLFAYQHTKLVPDVLTLAKSLGGGLPLGAMLVSQSLENVLKPGDHGSTFGGNPVSCAAGLATFMIITSAGFQNALLSKSNLLMRGLLDIQKVSPSIKAVRGLGMMIGIEIDGDAELIKNRAMKAGLLLNVTNKNVIRLLPPLTLSMHEIQQFLKIFRQILETK
jgi:predicted acetylornithine/succinylornithine family transaminase